MSQKKKNVFIRGYVDDIDKELLSSDVLLQAAYILVIDVDSSIVLLGLPIVI